MYSSEFQRHSSMRSTTSIPGTECPAPLWSYHEMTKEILADSMSSVDDMTDSLAQNIDPASVNDLLDVYKNSIPLEPISSAKFQLVESIYQAIVVNFRRFH